ncbi:MAG: TIGR00725 family protein [Fretibacterium sp.]|nr:TIGR00725 family protein [Fretibacterium sp.]
MNSRNHQENTLKKKKIVSVIGTSTATPELYELARETGRLLAERGCVVVCGGRGGVMEGVCRGVREGGGTSVGLLPTSIEEANPYVDLPIVTGLGELRNMAVASAGAALISIGGAYGTLTELGFALRQGKRVVGLRTWALRDEEGRPTPMLTAGSPEEAVDLALAEETR